MARRVRRGVKARRVVRRFELWSVAKVAVVFHLVCYALTIALLVVLWRIADRLGTISKLETFLSDFGFSDKASKKSFQLNGGALFHAVSIGGLGLVLLNTIGTVTLAFFYNGVSGLFGGIVVSVLEERTASEQVRTDEAVAGTDTASTPGSSAPKPRRRIRRSRRRDRKGVKATEGRPAGSSPAKP